MSRRLLLFGGTAAAAAALLFAAVARAAVPTVASFTPSSGGDGATVVITGTDFVGVTGVSFTLSPATTFTVDSPTQITATVPPNVYGPGKVRVTNADGTGASTTNFTPTAPFVYSFTPSTGANGSDVVITGNNLGNVTSVSLYYVNATFHVDSPTQITAQVPANVPGPGRWRVTNPNGTATSSSLFTPTAPIVTGFSPGSGGSGSTVTITGSNFTGATDVTLYFRPASFTVVNDTTIKATVPPDVPGPGKWRVTTPNGIGQSAAQYVPTSPAVTGFTPTSGPPGTQVTLTGINFTGVSQVTVYFVNASFVYNSPTSITVTIPAGMPGPGRFRVTTPNGLATSNDQFTPTAGSGGPASMPVISRGAPAFASSQLYPAADANDSDYTSYWRGSIPGWIAYDLSKVPAGQRGKVLVAWYNDPITSPYDHTITGEVAYNSLKSYTIQANAAAGGTGAPSSGWVTLATITGNVYHSRTALVDMTGYNWIRLNVTAADGSSGNSDAMFNLDVHDASQGVSDSWIFYGDSITQDGTYHEPVGSGNTGNFSQLIKAAKADHFPAYEDAGIGGLQSSDGAQSISKWLALFPGKYVALSYGTNDANGCGDTTAFYNNYVTMVTAVLNAGKVPVVPTIPWARTSDVQTCGPGFVAKIQALYTAYPQVVKGPDLWSYFKSNQSLISGDNLHPSAAGYAAFRQQWANAMLANVYGGS